MIAHISGVIGVLDGRKVLLGSDGLTLLEQSGYGRETDEGLQLTPEEALYLVARGRIEVADHDFDSLLGIFASSPDFIRRFLVYRDIRERGYVIQPGPQDFRVFRRGEKPGTGRSQYLLRVIPERQLIDFGGVAGEAQTASHMRKKYLLAVVDEEGELTYYEVRMQDELPPAPGVPPEGIYEGTRLGANVILKAGADSPVSEAWYGTPLDRERIMLSPAESLYLASRGVVVLDDVTALREAAMAADSELEVKETCYAGLRDRGYTPRTAYKFGHHFRVYSGSKTHSELLVHAVPQGAAVQMSVISRSVRLAHSVRKKMLFACILPSTIRYVEFSRIKL
jgi:tRNA-intron endonuclease